METRRVNPESVNKMKVAANNDEGKTDPIDARIIHMVATKWKTFSANGRPSPYQALRLLHKAFNEETDSLVRVKNRIHDALKELFCDLSKRARFVYTKTGRVLMEEYGFNPRKIVSGGRKSFARRVKSKVRIRSMDTIVQLWNDATQSVRNGLSDMELEALERRLAELWLDYERLSERKASIKREMEDIYLFLPEAAKLKPLRCLSEFEKARIIAESGPLDHFDSARQLLRYAGLNIIENDSGERTGQKRISKKGCVELRAALHLASARQIAKGGIFSGYHAGKIASGMIEGKVLTACARKLVKIIFGVYKSKTVFSEARLFQSESSLRKGQAA